MHPATLRASALALLERVLTAASDTLERELTYDDTNLAALREARLAATAVLRALDAMDDPDADDHHPEDPAAADAAGSPPEPPRGTNAAPHPAPPPAERAQRPPAVSISKRRHIFDPDPPWATPHPTPLHAPSTEPPRDDPHADLQRGPPTAVQAT